MAVKRIKSSMDVVTATRTRIKNVFSNNVPVYMSFSGGKDSLVMADITLKLINAGEIKPDLLTVIFVDEEAIYDCVEKTVMDWRKKFLLAGAHFKWLCVEVKHFSAYNQLTEDESYTCWDHTKEDVWIRRPPPFAIRNHPQLKPGIDNYQSFIPKITGDGIQLVGVRAAESVQRLKYMAQLNVGAGSSITGKNIIYPIYDWTTKDIWLYLKHNCIEIPIVYLWLYQTGTKKNQLRISQFFSVDCVTSLIHLAEYDPKLWEKILRREPNAYLSVLYWDSELYRRSSKQRRETEKHKDYKTIVMHMLFEYPDKYFTTDLTRNVAKQYRKLIIKMGSMARPTDYRNIHDALVAGDPKLRNMRSITINIASSYAEYSKKFCKGGEDNV